MECREGHRGFEPLSSLWKSEVLGRYTNVPLHDAGCNTQLGLPCRPHHAGCSRTPQPASRKRRRLPSWSYLSDRNVPPENFEISTHRLKVGCSSSELEGHSAVFNDARRYHPDYGVRSASGEIRTPEVETSGLQPPPFGHLGTLACVSNEVSTKKPSHLLMAVRGTRFDD